MPKTTKPERKALTALDEAADAAQQARKVAADLPKKPAKKLRSLAEDAADAADVSKKAVRNHPKRVRATAEKATDRVTKATGDALAKLDKAAAKAAKDRAAKGKAAKLPVAAAPTIEEPAAKITAAKATAAKATIVNAPPVPLEGLTVVVLRARARDAGRKGYSRLSKAQLIDLLS